MFGITNLISFSILFLSIVACITDIYRGKIYNELTLSGILLGLIYSFIHAYIQSQHLSPAFQSLFFSFVGVIVALFLFGWMFGFGFLGGGDVKLLMAYGAWVGAYEVVEIALFSVILGGIFSFGILIFSGNLFTFFKKLYRFIISLLIKELELELPKINKSLKMPFGIPLAISAILTHFYHPLIYGGFILW